MRMRRVILPGLAVAVLLGCAPAPQTTTVYERYEQLKNGPALQAAAAEPARRMRELDWMVGDWRTTITVFATAASPESRETTTTSFHLVGDSILASDDLSTILTYDPFEHDWISAGFEPPMAPLNNFRARWEGRRLVAEAPARIFGETFVLRQSLIRTGQNSFEILNEQRVKGDRFVPVDRYSFTRIVKPPQPPGQ